MNPSVGKVEAFGLLAGDVWAPERPSYLYNTLFNMAGSHPYSFVDDVDEGEAETEDDDGAVDWSHLIHIINDLLEEEDIDVDDAVVVESEEQDHGHSTDGDGVLEELPKPDDAAAAGEKPDDPADDGKTTEETPRTTFCSTTLAVAVPAVVSPSDDRAAAKGGGTRRRSSSSTQRRGGRRKKAPSLSSGAGDGESSSTTKPDKARADARKGLAGDLGRAAADAAAAPPAPRRSTARSARGRVAETRLSDGSGKPCFAPES